MSTHERNKENPSRNLLRVNIIRMRMEWKIPSPPLLKLQSEQSIGTQKTPSLSSSIAATVGQNGSEICMQKKSTDLVYDEKLTEWIYPIDETLEELDKLAYFCRDTNKDLVVKQLRGKSDGVFVIRPSGSRNRCLALSLCVPEEINKRRIANYLIVRNEHGYRIKGSKRYFQSLPQLITHHTVVEEQLPCRLRYSDWREIDIGTYENDVSKQINTEDTTTICLTDSESANSMAIRWRKLPDHQQSNSRITRVDREKFPDLLLGK